MTRKIDSLALSQIAQSDQDVIVVVQFQDTMLHSLLPPVVNAAQPLATCMGESENSRIAITG